MNSNLKRVLSVALMAALLAVNFMIPALAADITIQYNALSTTGLSTGQGTLFFEGTSSPNGLDTPNSQDRDYSPLDIWANPTRPEQSSLSMKANEWVRYEVSVAQAGYYAVDMTYACNARAGVNMLIRTDSNMIDVTVPYTGGNYTWRTAEDLGYLYLTAGTNYIYIDDRSATMNFKSLDLTLDATADASDVTIISYATDASEAGSFTPEISTSTKGYKVITVADNDLTFTVPVAVDGKYKVSIRGAATGDNEASVDFGGDAKTAAVSSASYEDTELGIFALTADTYTMTLTGLENYKLAWVALDYVAPYQTAEVSTSITDNEVVARGTDNFVITFNDVMDDQAASTATLTAPGAEIATEIDMVGETVTVSFLETLDFDTTYTLTLSGFQGASDTEALADIIHTFSTDVAGNDSGTETIDAIDVTAVREDVTVTGNILGTTGKGIKGRTVSIADPDSNEVATATTGDNGFFTLNFVIPAGTNVDVYNYTVTSEYGDTETAVVSYVSEQEELRILGTFTSATGATDVQTTLDTYSNLLGALNYTADMGTISNDTLFYNHFVGKTFASINDFMPFYNKALVMEQMNQAANGSSVYSIINQHSNCVLLGLTDYEAFKLLNTSAEKSSFGTAFQATPVANNEEGFYSRFETALNEFLLKQKQILAADGTYANTLDTTGAVTSVYFGGGISIPLKFTQAQKMVSSIDLTVTADNAAILSGIQAVAGGAIGTTATVSGNTANMNIEYSYIADKPYTNIGNIAISGGSLGTFNLTVGATVNYRISEEVNKLDENGNEVTENNQVVKELVTVDIPYTISTVVPSANITVVVSPMLDDTNRNDFGGGGYVAPPKEKEEEKEDEIKSAYFFDDMKEALWAQDMVHELVGKGVISKNTERAFRPMDNITREEVVKMLVTVIGNHNPDAKSTLSDVAADHWATSYIATAQELGIVLGNADGSFGLGTNITRQDMAVMIYRTFQMLGIDLTTGNAQFNDAGEIASYAQTAVSALEKQGIINGMGDNTFAPAANATRAQAAKVIYVMMEVLGL